VPGNSSILTHRGCGWAQLKNHLRCTTRDKAADLIEQMKGSCARTGGDEFATAAQILAGVQPDAAERVGEVCALLFHWASLQVWVGGWVCGWVGGACVRAFVRTFVCFSFSGPPLR
jgi:hypothetical protein